MKKGTIPISSWNTLANGTGVNFALGSTYKPIANTTLYAQYTTKRVTFNSNATGVTGSTAAQDAAGPTALTLNGFVRSGYTFVGWNTVADGTGTTYADGAIFPFSTDRTLYAQWARNLTVKASNRTATYTGSPAIISNSYSITAGGLLGSDSITSLTYTYTSVPSGTYNSQSAPTNAGSYVITPSAAVFSPGSASAYAITYETATLTIAKATQSITFGSLANRVYGSGSFTFPSSDTTSSGLSITFASTTPSICSTSGITVSLLAAGTCTITANQAGNDNFNAATQVTRSFTITKAATSLSSFTSITKTFGDVPFNLTAPTVTGSIPGTFSYISSNTAIASISGDEVTINRGGTVTITALFTPNDLNNYETSTITATLTVNRAVQSNLVITTTSVAYGENLSLATSGGSGDGVVTFVVSSGSCTISNSTLTPTDVGTCLITATKEADDNYLSETSIVTTITIITGAATASLSFTSTTFIFGITNPITVNTSVAGKVRFLANDRVIKRCKARPTTFTTTFTATCSYRPATRRPVTITAVLTPTDPGFATRTTSSETFLVAKRTGARG